MDALLHPGRAAMRKVSGDPDVATAPVARCPQSAGAVPVRRADAGLAVES